jgi:hypothetical protein
MDALVRNGTASQALVPPIAPAAVPFQQGFATTQNGPPASLPSGKLRPPRQPGTSYVPGANSNLTERQNYYFQRTVPELVQLLMEMDDFRAPSARTDGVVKTFLEDVKFAFLGGNRSQRTSELPAALETLEAAKNFNSKMRDTRVQATYWARSQDWRLVPHVEEALTNCKRSVLKELYSGWPIRKDLISPQTVINKATASARAAGLLPALPTTTAATAATAATNSTQQAAVDKYFKSYDTSLIVPLDEWSGGVFFFNSLDELLRVGLHGTEVKGESWTHYNWGPVPGAVEFTRPSTVNYSENLAGRPSGVTRLLYSNPFPTTVLLGQGVYSFDGNHWLPNPYPTNVNVERRKQAGFQALFDQGQAYLNKRPWPAPPP